MFRVIHKLQDGAHIKMAVPGRKVSLVLCEPCADSGNKIDAEGSCKECAENMCSKCFQHHRKGRICRNHVFLNDEYTGLFSSSTGTSGLLQDKCSKHVEENIKFYCSKHETIGCGDCMISEHKTCEVSYIAEVTMGLEENEYLEKVVKEIENCCNDIKEYDGKIKRNIHRNHAAYKRFTDEADNFKQEIVNKIEKLTVDVCKKADGIKTENLSKLQKLEKEISDITEELSTMKETAGSEKNESSNSLLLAIRLRERLTKIEGRFTEIDKMNQVPEYTFLKCSSIEKAIDNCKCVDLVNRKSGQHILNN